MKEVVRTVAVVVAAMACIGGTAIRAAEAEAMAVLTGRTWQLSQ